MDSSNPATTNSIYEQNGIIYFTVNPGTGSFTLVRGNGLALATADYDVLKSYNLILQGGWDGTNGAGALLPRPTLAPTPSLSGQLVIHGAATSL